jgi:hypothetical protein
MFNNRSNKQKFTIIATAMVVLIWVSYQFSFSKTIDLWKECKRLEQQQALIKAIPEQLPVLTGKIAQLEKILGNSGDGDFSTLILDQVNTLCQQNNVKLKEIPEKHVFNGENLIVETLDVNLQGSFSDQLRIISELEKGEAKARLRSIRLQTIINQSTGERKLQSTLFLQSIKLLSNNSNPLGYEKNDN